MAGPYKTWLISFGCAAALLLAVGGRALIVPVLAAGAVTLLITAIRAVRASKKTP